VYQLLWKSGERAKFQDGYTQRDLAEALHVSPQKVRRWVRLGWLILYQGRVKDRSLKRFLEGHSDEIDPRRLEGDMRLWLEALGFRADSAHPWQWFRDRKQTLKSHVCDRCGSATMQKGLHSGGFETSRPRPEKVAGDPALGSAPFDSLPQQGLAIEHKSQEVAN
jgi:hypothetical protein